MSELICLEICAPEATDQFSSRSRNPVSTFLATILRTMPLNIEKSEDQGLKTAIGKITG